MQVVFCKGQWQHMIKHHNTVTSNCGTHVEYIILNNIVHLNITTTSTVYCYHFISKHKMIVNTVWSNSICLSRILHISGVPEIQVTPDTELASWLEVRNFDTETINIVSNT